MKIAYIYDCLYPYIKGGAEKRYYEITERIKDGHEVHFFSMKYWKEGDVFLKNKTHYHGAGETKKLYVSSGRRSIFQALYFSFKLIKPLFREKFDLIDCSSFPYFSIFPCWLYSKIKKVPLVITWHEYWSLGYWINYIGILGIIGYIIQKLSLLFSKNIIAVSKFTKAKLVKAGKRSGSITVIENGLDLEQISKINSSIEKSSNIIFVGRLIREKNVNLIIEATNKLKSEFKNIKLIIIGEGPEKEDLTKLSKKLNLEDNITFIPFQKNINNIYTFLKSSNILIIPSEREGFGMIVIEANASGLPVITVNHKGNAAKDLIKDGYNGFVVNLNTEDIYKKTKEILENKNILEELILNSKEISKKYDWSKIIKKLNNYYLNLVNENSSNTS